MWLLAGLGNPGARYEQTRHNIGFMALHDIGASLDFPTFNKNYTGLASQGALGDPVLLLKPQTFMNLSGESVQQATQFYKIAPAQLIVLHDEIDLPLGEVKLKKGGGSAGHNGLESISQHIGPEFGRIRIGVGHPRGTPKAVADHVLEPFAVGEKERVGQILDQVAGSIQDCLALFRERDFSNQKLFTLSEI
jgi:PTH1 family peptidyl-tRNA hydrolase